MEKGLSFIQLAGALAFVLFSETQRLLASMLQPAALAMLAPRAAPCCTPKDKVGGAKTPQY